MSEDTQRKDLPTSAGNWWAKAGGRWHIVLIEDPTGIGPLITEFGEPVSVHDCDEWGPRVPAPDEPAFVEAKGETSFNVGMAGKDYQVSMSADPADIKVTFEGRPLVGYADGRAISVGMPPFAEGSFEAEHVKHMVERDRVAGEALKSAVSAVCDGDHPAPPCASEDGRGVDRKALRESAAKASPGPWSWMLEQGWLYSGDASKDHGSIVLAAESSDWTTGPDADYLAAVDPSTILALLDALDEAVQAASLAANQREALEALAILEARPPNDGSGVDLRIRADGALLTTFETAEERRDRMAGWERRVASAWALDKWDRWAMGLLGLRGEVRDHGREKMREAIAEHMRSRQGEAETIAAGDLDGSAFLAETPAGACRRYSERSGDTEFTFEDDRRPTSAGEPQDVTEWAKTVDGIEKMIDGNFGAGKFIIGGREVYIADPRYCRSTRTGLSVSVSTDARPDQEDA